MLATICWVALIDLTIELIWYVGHLCYIGLTESPIHRDHVVWYFDGFLRSWPDSSSNFRPSVRSLWNRMQMKGKLYYDTCDIDRPWDSWIEATIWRNGSWRPWWKWQRSKTKEWRNRQLRSRWRDWTSYRLIRQMARWSGGSDILFSSSPSLHFLVLFILPGQLSPTVPASKATNTSSRWPVHSSISSPIEAKYETRTRLTLVSLIESVLAWHPFPLCCFKLESLFLESLLAATSCGHFSWSNFLWSLLVYLSLWMRLIDRVRFGSSHFLFTLPFECVW